MAVSANDEPTTVEITEDGAQGLTGAIMALTGLDLIK